MNTGVAIEVGSRVMSVDEDDPSVGIVLGIFAAHEYSVEHRQIGLGVPWVYVAWSSGAGVRTPAVLSELRLAT